MDLREAIKGRRSVRSFEDLPVPRETVQELINTGIYAPTGSNMQPWGFAVVEDKQLMQKWSDRAKELMLSVIDEKPQLQRYKALLENKEFNIFHGASCLLLIYGSTTSTNYIYDCSMVAQNIMLAAYEKGIGSCWIGFATALGNLPDIKEILNVPGDYNLVAPLVLGYPRRKHAVVPRKEPVMFNWI
ncbi:MAG: nitroreductase family protein [Firmicutes bacterium]|nr:nitroreductase family protein [Bacillota bacterium]